MLAAQAIRAGDADLVAAGGMESMSRAPHLLAEGRTGTRLGDGRLIDSMIHDGLWDAAYQVHMGECGERTADRYGITREQMDLYAAGSHLKAVAAAREGRFAAELAAVEGRKPLEADEGPRSDSTVQALASLAPVFRKDGRLTAGNSSQISDGAAAVVVASGRALQRHGLRPLARITGAAAGGVDPQWMLMAPAEAAANLRRRWGVKLEEMELVELNEAFAVQCCALLRQWELDPARLNVHGGAVALGHPIGASGARVLVTLVHALRARGARRGLATLCLGGGNAVALSVEAA
jgi:acetyl-CoA C-acetyltransferase